MIDVVIFAVIAAVLVFKLWSQLGKRSDGDMGAFDFSANARKAHEPKAAKKPNKFKPESPEAVVDAEFADIPREPQKPDYSAYGQAEQGLLAIKDADSSFTPEGFLKGAEMAFEMILEGFADGNKELLQPLIGSELYQSFNDAIDERNAAGHVKQDTLIGIDKISITDSRLTRGTAIITVAIHSQQVSVTYDATGELIDGDEASAVQKIDVWVFERKIKSKDPNWLLVATSVGG